MEAIGLAASVIQVLQAVTQVIRIAKTLYEAPEEFSALQEQLDNFNAVLQEVNNLSGNGINNIVKAPLLHARLTITQLNQLFTDKLLRKSKSSLIVRRRAWLKNKSKIRRLRESLKEGSTNIVVALSAASAVSSSRTEASLKSTKQEVTEVITNAIGTTLRDMYSSFQTANTITSVHPCCPSVTQRLNQHQQLSLYHVSGGLLGQLNNTQSLLPNVTADNRQSRNENLSGQLQQPFGQLILPRSSTARPASPFELSQNFYPEQYTLTGSLNPRSTLFRTSELYHTPSTRVDKYQLTFAQSARQWRRVTVLASIDRQSKFWGLTRVGGSYGDKTSLPGTLKEQLEDLLLDIDFSCEVTGLSIQILDTDEEKGPTFDKNSMCIYEDRSETTSFSLNVKEFVDNLGCPKFHPNEVIVRRYLYRSDTFLVSLHGSMYGEIRLGFGSDAVQRQLYQIQLLHCLNGLSAIIPFKGVILDDRTQELRGFVKELPAKGLMFDIMRKAEQENSIISWERRQKWARQLIEGVSQAHSRGFVVGSLGRLLCVGIDGEDNARLYKFRSTISRPSNHQGFLPPEFRHQTISDCGTIVVTPGLDLFQLGMLLWRLAEYKTTQGGPSMFCAKFDCSCSSTGICHAVHTNPIALPSLEDAIPEFYQQIVSTCRAEHSSQRLPALQLLKMFPFPAEPTPQLEHPTTKITQLSESSTVFYCRMICDHCGKKPLEHYYHCNTCSSGHYDLCQDCTDGGVHCLDGTHFLLEKIKKKNEFLGTRRYHSKVTASGEQRHTIFQFKEYSSTSF